MLSTQQPLPFPEAIKQFRKALQTKVEQDFDGEQAVQLAVKYADQAVQAKLNELIGIDSTADLTIAKFNKKAFFGNADAIRSELEQDLKAVSYFMLPSLNERLGQKTINRKNPIDGPAVALYALESSSGVAADNEGKELISILDLLSSLEAKAILARSKTVYDAARNLRRAIEEQNEALIDTTLKQESGVQTDFSSDPLPLLSDGNGLASRASDSSQYGFLPEGYFSTADSNTYFPVGKNKEAQGEYLAGDLLGGGDNVVGVDNTDSSYMAVSASYMDVDAASVAKQEPEKVVLTREILVEHIKELYPDILYPDIAESYLDSVAVSPYSDPSAIPRKINALVNDVTSNMETISRNCAALAKQHLCKVSDLHQIREIYSARKVIRDIFSPSKGKENEVDRAMSDFLTTAKNSADEFFISHKVEPKPESLEEAYARFNFKKYEFREAFANYEDFSSFMLAKYGLETSNAKRSDLVINVSDAAPYESKLVLSNLWKEFRENLDYVERLTTGMQNGSSFAEEKAEDIREKIQRMGRLLKIEGDRLLKIEGDKDDMHPISFFFFHCARATEDLLQELEKENLKREESEKAAEQLDTRLPNFENSEDIEKAAALKDKDRSVPAGEDFNITTRLRNLTAKKVDTAPTGERSQ